MVPGPERQSVEAARLGDQKLEPAVVVAVDRHVPGVNRRARDHTLHASPTREPGGELDDRAPPQLPPRLRRPAPQPWIVPLGGWRVRMIADVPIVDDVDPVAALASLDLGEGVHPRRAMEIEG